MSAKKYKNGEVVERTGAQIPQPGFKIIKQN